QPRSHCVRIGRGEEAVTPPRTIALIGRGPQQSAGGGVGHGRRETADPVENLSSETLVVPAQAILDAELARYLPTVLSVKRPGAFPALRSGRVRNAGGVHRAQQKTGIGQSNAATRYRLPLGVGKTRLRAAEIVDAGG